jgi:hypothetical protein
MNSNPEKQKQLKKIVVKSSYELTDVLALITETDTGRVQLTFTEFSDLLVSPINLKVIQEIADEQDKNLILQIISNAAGIRNAQEAGLIFTDSVENITEDFWENSFAEMEKRIRKNEEMLKKSSASKQTSPIVSKPVESNTIDIADLPKEENMKDTVEEMVEQIKEDVGDIADKGTDLTDEEEPMMEAPQEKSEYSKRVEQAINKSKQVIEQGGVRVVKSGSLEIALDDDIAQVHMAQEKRENDSQEPLPTKIQGLTGRDLLTEQQNLKDETPISKSSSKKGVFSGVLSVLTPVSSSLKQLFTKIGTFFKSKAGKKGITYILVPTILTVVLGLWLAYRLSPIVNISAEITSIPVAIDEEFTGDPSVTEFSMENSKIRVKKETVDKELSDNAIATGVGSRGEKAGGSVTVKCLKFDGTESITAGTVFVSGGKSYNSVNDIAVSCPGIASATVQANEVGEDFNIPSGSVFSIGVYGADVSGVNDGGALTGGSKEEFVVISSKDIEDLSKTLIDSAKSDAESELNNYVTDGWILIDSTLKHGDAEDIETDKPVGTETDLFNLSLSTSSSALYYNKQDLEDVADNMLLDAAKEKNLFEDSSDLELILDSEIIKSITFKSVKGNTVKVDMTVSGSVVPKIDEQKILDYLQGMKWQEGTDYLKGLTFFTSEPTVSFSPTWIPESMWYFPSRQGRTLLKITEVETVEVVETPEVIE